jgi:arginine metabolism regulation protein II
MPLIKDPNISLLLHHYQTHVADLLQPVFHDRNPWRTTYFPFALQGCPDSIMAQIPQAPSGVFSSLFHSLISAAAFHLRNLLDGSPKYHKIGLQHRAKALHALNSSIGLVTPTRPEQYTVYITAMLALVTIDVSGLQGFSSLPDHLY